MPPSRKYRPLSAPYAPRRGRPPLAHRPAANTNRNLIPLNTNTIRKKALKDYEKHERALEQLKAQLKQHHERDIPGFRSWLHQTFGQILTRSRELVEKLRDKQAFINEIASLVHRHQLSEPEAYLKAKWRRAHPKEAEAEDLRLDQEEEQRRKQNPGSRDPQNDEGDEDDPFGMGDGDFKSIPDEDWDDFGDFFENFFGHRPPARTPRRSHAEEKTVKELYRAIVRRLHPDHHGHMTDARKNLWHEAQAAYSRHDTQALQSILARCDSEEAGLGTHTPISQILLLSRRLKQALQSTRSEIRHAKSDPAWDYQTRITKPAFVRKIRADLTNEADYLTAELNSIDTLLAELEWMATHPPPPRKPSKTRRGRKPPANDENLDWLF
jgi:hypothetical protein